MNDLDFAGLERELMLRAIAAKLALEPGEDARVGRYAIRRRIGEGGMGVVYEGWDAELERAVAVKLLRPRKHEDDEREARMRREARAMARLSHANVVHVHEFGVHEGRLFIAMEYVAGRTLSRWLAAEPRTWARILAVFVAAGRGLAAAHACGLVHRDFKPDNVLMTEAGAVKVSDFGLVTSVAVEVGIEAGSEAGSEAGAASGEPASEPGSLTQTGILMGTPRYMSPEQYRGASADARSDQFSFCVALWEALTGVHPFAADRSAVELEGRVLAGERVARPERCPAPAWLLSAVERGLEVDPDRRWPSMDALLEAIEDDPRVRRRRWWAIAAVVGLLGGTAWGSTALVQAQARADARLCAGLEAELDGVWDRARRRELEAAFEASGSSYAATTWARVELGLGAYADAWLEARVDACEAHRDGLASGELLDREIACLDERREHIEALVDELAGADAGTIEHAVEAVAELPSLARCTDVDALTAERPVPEDPNVAAEVEALDQRLIVAATKQRVGDYPGGLALADAIVAEAVAHAHEPLMARAWLRQGILQERMGDYEAAGATLARAYDAAVARSLTDEAAAAAAELVNVFERLARYDEAHAWAVHADPLARAAGPDARARHHHYVGLLAAAEGDYPRAREQLERSLALELEREPISPLHLATSHHDLGDLATRAGDYAEAHAHLERALELRRAELGPEHPDLASTLENLANVAQDRGELDEARALYEQVLAIRRAALGPEHVDVGAALGNLANVVERQGEHALARSYFEDALAIFAAGYGPEHPAVASTYTNLGLVSQSEGQLDDARVQHQRALAIFTEVVGPEHFYVGFCLGNLGNVSHLRGELERATREYEGALAIFEAAFGVEHPAVIDALNSLATLAAEAGDPIRARERYERALAIQDRALGEAGPVDPSAIDRLTRTLVGLAELALAERDHDEALALAERALAVAANPTTRFCLARALAATGAHERADELAQLARDELRERGDADEALAELGAWLAARGAIRHDP